MNNTNTIKFIVKTFDDKSKVFTCSQNITILEFQKLLYSHIFNTNNTNTSNNINNNNYYNKKLKEQNLKKIYPDVKNINFIIYNKCISFQNHPKDFTLQQLFKRVFPNTKFQQLRQSNIIEIEWYGKLRGGIFMLLINTVITIFKLLLYIPKFIIWVAEVIIYLIKVMVYLIKVAIDVFSVDGFMGLLNYIVGEIVLAPIKFTLMLLKKFFNTLGDTTVKAIWGVDNVRDYETSGDDNSCMGDKKCYKTPDGTVPFSVVIATILCPPVGVFMEYGLMGWFNILIAALLTLMFYFPGLIYSLIILYC